MRAQLEFASMAVDAYTQGAKFWWDFWGAVQGAGHRSGGRGSRDAAALPRDTQGSLGEEREPDLSPGDGFVIEPGPMSRGSGTFLDAALSPVTYDPRPWSYQEPAGLIRSSLT
jgi:hypothetical protein